MLQYHSFESASTRANQVIPSLGFLSKDGFNSMSDYTEDLTSQDSNDTYSELLKEPLTKVVEQSRSRESLIETSISKQAISNQSSTEIFNQSMIDVFNEDTIVIISEKSKTNFSHETRMNVSNKSVPVDSNRKVLKNEILRESLARNLKQSGYEVSLETKKNIPEVPITEVLELLTIITAPKTNQSQLRCSSGEESESKVSNETKAKFPKPFVKVSEQSSSKDPKRLTKNTLGRSNESKDPIPKELSVKASQHSSKCIQPLVRCRNYQEFEPNISNKIKDRKKQLVNIPKQSRRRFSKGTWTETSEESNGSKDPILRKSSNSEQSSHNFRFLHYRSLKNLVPLFPNVKQTKHEKGPNEHSRSNVSESQIAKESNVSEILSTEGSRTKVPVSTLTEEWRTKVSESTTAKDPKIGKKCEEMELAFTTFIGDRSPSFIDSHCHLDFLINREDYGVTYGHFMLKHKDTYPEMYEGCVAVFCNPFTFKKSYVWQRYLEEKGVWGAFGCHPNNAHYYDDSVENALCTALKHPKVRALGEIGLDYSRRNGCSKRVQHRTLRRQLYIAVSEGLPLVIHCRDAHEDCMRILKEIVPRDHLVHLHCFTGDWTRAQSWLEAFSNLFFGFTNWIAHAKNTRHAVCNIPLDRLLLETDAPYFVPSKMTGRSSHPGMAIYVAMEIATLKQLPLDKVLHWTRFNTHRMYSI